MIKLITKLVNDLNDNKIIIKLKIYEFEIKFVNCKNIVYYYVLYSEGKLLKCSLEAIFLETLCQKNVFLNNDFNFFLAPVY